MLMETKKTTEIEDATIIAFLSLKGHHINPYRRADGRVVFKVSGDISHTLHELYSNVHIGILDYIKSLKTIRSSIFTIKAFGRGTYE
jgi:hypothetical protein